MTKTRLKNLIIVMAYCFCLISIPLRQLAGIEHEFNISSLNIYETATNRNFRILLNEKPVFLRVGRDNANQIGINRKTEIKHYKMAEGLGLAPKLLAYQIDNGILITEFVEGNTPSETKIHDVNVLKKIALCLKKLHTCKYKDQDEPTNNVFLKNDRLLDQLSALDTDASFEKWLEVRRSFEKDYYDGIDVGICHGDLFRGNLLETTEGKLFLIDWEYSYLGPVIDDLGKLCSANWLTDEEIKLVAEAYWKSPNSKMVDKIKQNIYMQQMNLYLWCKIQAYHELQTASNYLSLAARAKEHLNQLGPQLLQFGKSI